MLNIQDVRNSCLHWVTWRSCKQCCPAGLCSDYHNNSQSFLSKVAWVLRWSRLIIPVVKGNTSKTKTENPVFHDTAAAKWAPSSQPPSTKLGTINGGIQGPWNHTSHHSERKREREKESERERERCLFFSSGSYTPAVSQQQAQIWIGTPRGVLQSPPLSARSEVKSDAVWMFKSHSTTSCQKVMVWHASVWDDIRNVSGTKRYC